MHSTGDINDIQASILRQLSGKDGLRFAEINIDKVPSDQFSYHLRQLIKYGLIVKTADNLYSLSTIGRSRTIMLYPNQAGFIEQGFLAVRVVLTKTENDTRYFLMQERALVPFKGTYATPGDKILFGEDVTFAARRTMEQQTGLVCDVRVRGLRHIKDQYEGSVVQDKYFFVFSAANPKGALLPESPTGKGKNVWLSHEELLISGRSIQGGVAILDMATEEQFVFAEDTLVVDSY